MSPYKASGDRGQVNPTFRAETWMAAEEWCAKNLTGRAALSGPFSGEFENAEDRERFLSEWCGLPKSAA